MPACVLSDGAAMHYADDGAGPAVLLVHGWAAHGGFFNDLRVRLSRTHRVLTPTLRGHPGSARGARPLTVEALGEDIAAFAAALRLERFVALGWSMGAMALWAAAPALGPRLAGLIVEEMSPKLVNDGDWRFGLAGGYDARNVEATLTEIRTDWPAYVTRFAPRMAAAETNERRPQLVAWAAAEMAKADPAAMAELWASMAAQDFRAALGEIDCPMLALHGAGSQVYPEGATQFVARTAPRGASLVLSGAGHMPHLEAPESFFQTVSAFLEEARPQNLLREGVRP